MQTSHLTILSAARGSRWNRLAKTLSQTWYCQDRLSHLMRRASNSGAGPHNFSHLRRRTSGRRRWHQATGGRQNKKRQQHQPARKAERERESRKHSCAYLSFCTRTGMVYIDYIDYRDSRTQDATDPTHVGTQVFCCTYTESEMESSIYIYIYIYISIYLYRDIGI